MKAINHLKVYLLVLFSFVCFQYNYASHSAGGYINYRCVDTTVGRYEITLHLFRDCSGIMFGAEQIQVITSTSNTTHELTKISTKEVTPICQVPDVTVRPTTNCPSGAIGNIQGIEKSTFRAYITLGKNKGWALIGWGTCCRLNVISNIQNPAGEMYWIQAAINTNHKNSSPLYNSEAANYLWAKKENWIDFSARDSFDSKYIVVGGRHIVRDSLVYEFYTPNTGLAPNINNSILLQNPSVNFIQGLSANQFLNSNPTISLNKSAGIARVSPRFESHSVAAVVVKEYRAIPSSNGMTYTRELIGYTCRDQVFITKSSGTEIYSEGIIADSSNVEFIVNPNLARTCRAKGNKIVMKFSAISGTSLKVKDVSVINSQEISNYNFKVTSKQVGNQTTAHVEFKFDRNFATLGYEFKIKVYYCNASGISVENYIPLSVLFSNASIRFEQDTLLYCSNAGIVPLSLPLAKKVSWKSNNAIVSSANLDSNLVNILPSNSHWIYATNLKHSELCKVNDSIYVKMETCNQVKGNIYHDVNNNCSYDPSLDLPAKIPLNLKGKTSSYNQTIYPDNSGNYSFSPPTFNNYTLTVNNVIVNCNSKVNVFDVYLVDSPTIVNIAVKDSPSFEGYPLTPKTLNYCVGETANAEFVLPFVKSMGYVKAKMDYGNGEFEERVLGMEPMQSYLVFNKTYTVNGTYPASIRIYTFDDKLMFQTALNTISISSCLQAKVFIDMNDDCNLDQGDISMSGTNIELKDISANQKQNGSTNADGIASFYVKNGVQYSLSNLNIIACNQDKKDLTFNFPNLDTNYQLNVPLDKFKIIPTVEASIDILNNNFEHCINSQRNFTVKVTKSIGNVSMKLLCNDGQEYTKDLPFEEGIYTYSYAHTFLNKFIGTVRVRFYLDADTIYNFTSNDFSHLLCRNFKAYRDINENCIFDNEQLMAYLRFKVTNLLNSTVTYAFSKNNGDIRLKLTENDHYKIESPSLTNCNNSHDIIFKAVDTAISHLDFPIQRLFNYQAYISLHGRRIDNTSDFKFTLLAQSTMNNDPKTQIDSLFTYELDLPNNCIFKNVNTDDGVSYESLGSNRYRLVCPRKIGARLVFPIVTVEFRNLKQGDILCFGYRLKQVGNEKDIFDNYYRICREAFTAYDPNNKIPAIRSSINTEDFIDKTNPITYTINFQNEGKAPARDVYILDQLSSRLNWESLEIKHASHPMSVSLSNTGQLRFDFKDIILPEKAVDEEGSKGHVIFTIQPKSDLQIGEEIKNTGEIYFDANDAVITNTAISRLVKPSGQYNFFNVSTTSYPENAGVTYGQGRYLFDDNVLVEAKPLSGYQFKYWVDNGVASVFQPSYSFISNKDRILTAHFTKSTSEIKEASWSFKISPNPASDFIHIAMEKSHAKYTVRLTTLDGKLVGNYMNPTRIPLESLARGTYILELESDEVKRTEKLILR